MADKNGKFLGTGLSEIKHSKLFLKENIIFPTSGKYSFSIWQAMRRNGEKRGETVRNGEKRGEKVRNSETRGETVRNSEIL